MPTVQPAAVIYDKVFLEKSWTWLTDPEIAHLTMTPKFSREGAAKWFEALPQKEDYKIWGVMVDERPIGAFGIKGIQGQEGEYWGYIGEKEFWGKGIGKWLIATSIEKATTLGLKKLTLRVIDDNARAISLYTSTGFHVTGRESRVLLMERDLVPQNLST